MPKAERKKDRPCRASEPADQMTARALCAIEEARIVGVYCHGEASQLAARGQLPRARRFSDYDEMLRSVPVDVVCVSVPNHRHAEFAVSALRRGAHVFLEKPLGLSLDECDAVIAASRENGRLVALDHEFRVSHQWGAARGPSKKVRSDRCASSASPSSAVPFGWDRAAGDTIPRASAPAILEGLRSPPISPSGMRARTASRCACAPRERGRARPTGFSIR